MDYIAKYTCNPGGTFWDKERHYMTWIFESHSYESALKQAKKVEKSYEKTKLEKVRIFGSILTEIIDDQVDVNPGTK